MKTPAQHDAPAPAPSGPGRSVYGDILAPAHCGWCGRGLPASKAHCSSSHRRRHEAAAASLGRALQRITPRDAIGLSERSARRVEAEDDRPRLKRVRLLVSQKRVPDTSIFSRPDSQGWGVAG